MLSHSIWSAVRFGGKEGRVTGQGSREGRREGARFSLFQNKPSKLMFTRT